MSIPPLSHRSLKTPPSPIRKLSGMAEAAEARGTKVHRINIGQPDIKSPPQFLEGIEHYHEEVVAYETSSGCYRLREEWSAYINKDYPIGVTADRLLITMGASEALIFAFMVCCDPGDEILIFDPTYANYIGFSAISGVRLVPLPCTLEDAFALPNRAEIERFISPYTKAILVCSPNNPTGAVCTDPELEMLISICRDKDLYLVVDETYREFVYDGRRPRCVFELAPKDPHIIVVDSLSKRFSLCGARLGYLMTWHEGVMQAALHIAQARLAAPTIEQSAAAYMLRHLPDSYLPSVISEYTERRNRAVTALRSIPGVEVFAPVGGFYLVAKLPISDTEDFATYLLRDFSFQGETVFVAPAGGFYMHRDAGNDKIRIAFVLQSEVLERAIAVLGQGLKAYMATTIQN